MFFTKLSGNKLTLFNLITGLISVAVQFAVSFFLSPFIVKHLGAEANGFTQLASNFVSYASLFSIAFNSMAGRFISIQFHKNNIEKAEVYLSSVYVANILFLIVLLPIAILVVAFLPQFVIINTVNVLDVQILFACVFANFFLGLWLSLYRIAFYIKNAVYYCNILNMFQIIANACLLLFFFGVFPVRIFYVSFVAFLLTFILLFVYRKFYYKLLPELSFSFKSFSLCATKEMFLSGIWNTVNQCGHIMMTGFDLLLANWFLTPALMGVVAISKTIPAAIMQLGTIVNSNFSPSVTISWAKGDKNEMLKDLRLSIKISTVLLSVPLVTFCFFGIQFYTLWMPSENAILLTTLSSLGVLSFVFFSGTQALYNVYTAANKLQVNSISFVSTGFLNAIIVFLYLKSGGKYGVYAIVGVSSILSIIRNTFLLPYISYLLQVKWYEFYKDILKTCLCVACNVIVCFVVSTFFSDTNWGTLFCMIVITASLTVCVDLLLLFNKKELYFLKNILMIFLRKYHIYKV